MPIQTQNFAGIEPIGIPTGIGSLFSDMLKTSNLKHKNTQESEKARYAPEMAKAELQHKQAQTLNQQRQAEFGNLTGDAQKAFSLHLLEQKLGPDHPAVKQAKEMYEREKKNESSMINYRDQLTRNFDKRTASAMGKLEMERQDIVDGIKPGTRENPVAISPEEQGELLGQWNNKILKENTDTKTRERTLYATNIDKTLESFKPEDLVRYAGVAGNLKKKVEQGKALVGKESEDYRKYEEALTAVQFLTSQARQFYGESVQPSVRKHLEELADPSTWINNPKIALRKFNQMKSILEKETGTYRKALKGTSVYNKPEEGHSEKFSKHLSSGNIQGMMNGKQYNIPADKREAFIKAGGSINE